MNKEHIKNYKFDGVRGDVTPHRTFATNKKTGERQEIKEGDALFETFKELNKLFPSSNDRLDA